MPKYLFKSSQNRWFYRFALILSLLVLMGILLVTYVYLSDIDNIYQFRLLATLRNLRYALGISILLLTISAWFLSKQLTFKPFAICTILIVLYIAKMLISHRDFNIIWQPFTLFTQMILYLSMLSLLWWLSCITKPASMYYRYTDHKNLRWVTFIGLLMIIAQILLLVWVRANTIGVSHSQFAIFSPLNTSIYDIKSLIDFWISNSMVMVDHLTLMEMIQRSLQIILLIYFSILGLILLKDKHLISISVSMLLLVLCRLLVSFFDTGSLDGTILRLAHFSISILFLLTTLSLLSRLYPKIQSSW